MEFDRYLEIEELMNKFFEKHNFCITNCRDKGNNIGCCEKDFYKDLFLEFHKERTEKYGEDIQEKNKCGYHCENGGCRLKTYKSPLCLGFICKDYVGYLKNLGIEWNSSEMIKILSEVLDGNNESYETLKTYLKDLIK